MPIDIEKIKELHELMKAGVLNESEFQKAKDEMFCSSEDAGRDGKHAVSFRDGAPVSSPAVAPITPTTTPAAPITGSPTSGSISPMPGLKLVKVCCDGGVGVAVLP